MKAGKPLQGSRKRIKGIQGQANDGNEPHTQRDAILPQTTHADHGGGSRLHKDLNRGWSIGTKEGKTGLKLKVKQGVASANREAKTELESLRLEELLSSSLRHLGKGQHDIETDKKSVQWKIAIASHPKASTGIRNPHLCSSLNMGIPQQ